MTLAGTRRHLGATLLAGVVAASFTAELLLGQGGLTRRALGEWGLYLHFLLLAALPIPLLLARARLRDLRGAGAGPRFALRQTLQAFRREYLAPGRVRDVALAALAIAVVINIFGAWKLAIPVVQPFAWDRPLHELDMALHGGRMPWELLQPLLGAPWVTSAIDAAYFLWHPVVGLTAACAVWSADTRLRLRFLIAFAGSWLLLGNVAAMALSSAGPCYWGPVVGGVDPYAGLFEYLRGVDATHPLAALRIQEGLWARHAAGGTAPHTGISAMPSVHVAMPVLFTLFALPRSRRWGLVFAVYSMVTLLGSVHLGWHYAVDGYAAAAGAWGLWGLAGLIPAGRPSARGGTTRRR